jgi:hypothetical protein
LRKQAANDPKRPPTGFELGFKIDKSVPPLEREIQYLLYDLCVDWGVCIPPHDAERISVQKQYTAEQFASDVLLAEGMNPEYERKWLKKISAKFVERFGCDEVSAATFVDRVK